MTYKLMVMPIYSYSNMDLSPPDGKAGWHVEKIVPLDFGHSEVVTGNVDSWWTGSPSEERRMFKETGRSVSRTMYVGVLWKWYAPSEAPHTDDVGEHQEAKAWA